MTETKSRKPKKRSSSGRKGAHPLDATLRLIPGYDPWANADGCWIDYDRAQLCIDFFAECLHHIEGSFAGKPFVLEPWQKAVTGNLFGWMRRNEKGEVVRRYREVLIYVPRKNGKTPYIAGVCLLLLCIDREPGAQIYSAAGDAEQAALLFRHAKGMVEAEPSFANRLKVYGGFAHRSIVYEGMGSAYRVISANANTKHGHNTHAAFVDELHVQDDDELVNVMRTAMASRRQPLLAYMTTADYARESVCNKTYQYALKVRDGVVEDPAFLPVIYEASREDDWTSPEVWAKANPNLGVSVSKEYLERECQRAKEEPSYENTFKRLHLNIITEQAERWLQLHHWDECKGDVDLDGRECFGGLDLSARMDLSSFALCFPLGEDRFAVKAWFWVPEEAAKKREQFRIPIQQWAKEGWIEITPGNEVDYKYLRERILDLSKQYVIRDIGFDPWNATQFCQSLAEDDGFKMVEYRQGYISMNEPSKAFERSIVSKRLIQDGNPVLRWNISNATIRKDPAGNIKPDKAKSTEKIDGVVASIMAMGRAMFSKTKPSVYSKRGLVVI